MHKDFFSINIKRISLIGKATKSNLNEKSSNLLFLDIISHLK